MTAVAAEAEACAGCGADVLTGGVGPAAAAAATAAALAAAHYNGVLSAGIGGGFPAAPVGSLAVATRAVFADLGARTAEGFIPLDELGFGTTSYPAALCRPLADRLAAAGVAHALGAVLTVATVTGTARDAEALTARHSDALAEGMEGAGVAEAAARVGVPFGEIRAISNLVGPRERSAWRIGDALVALRRALTAIGDLG